MNATIIDEQVAEDLKYYPNPTEDYRTIKYLRALQRHFYEVEKGEAPPLLADELQEHLPRVRAILALDHPVHTVFALGALHGLAEVFKRCGLSAKLTAAETDPRRYAKALVRNIAETNTDGHSRELRRRAAEKLCKDIDDVDKNVDPPHRLIALLTFEAFDAAIADAKWNYDE